MSGIPNPNVVERLRLIASRFRVSYDRQLELVESIRTQNKELELATQSANQARRELVEQLESMDCDSRGNTGWENRIAWMFAELDRQSSIQTFVKTQTQAAVENPEIETFEDETFCGVYATEGDGECPIALFSSLSLAQGWLKSMRDANELGADYCILKTKISGEYRNHLEACEPVA